MFLSSADGTDLPPSSAFTRFAPGEICSGRGRLGVDAGKLLSVAAAERKWGLSGSR